MNQRYYALDVFRGATVALMILVNNPGSWEYIYPPLDHSLWHGCTPTDLVFPFFLFAVGNSLAFVIPKYQNKSSNQLLLKVLKRTLLIFSIGLFLNWSPFLMYQNGSIVPKTWTWLTNNGIAGVRIMGVLQRIALCYFSASLIILYGKNKGAAIIGSALLCIYWWLCYYFGTSENPYTLLGYFGTKIDINLLGISHIYKGEGIPFDPEGIPSTIPAIVQVIIGYFIGNYILIHKDKTPNMLTQILLAGITLVFLGYCWDGLFPINKKIWTSSYTLYTCGLATLVLGVLIFLIEEKKSTGAWSKFFDVFGKNPLFIFVLSGLLPRILNLIKIKDGFNEDHTQSFTNPMEWFYDHLLFHLTPDPRFGSCVYAILIIILYWSIARILDQKKIYIKV